MRVISAKLYPTQEQERVFFHFLDISRKVYNLSLEHRIKAWERRKERVHLYKQFLLLTEWRCRIPDIGSIPAQISREAIRRVDLGIKSFFRRVKHKEKNSRFPRFKSRARWRSFEVLQPGKYLRDGNRVYIPGVGPVRYRGLNSFDGPIKGLRVVKRASGWHVQLTVGSDNSDVVKRNIVTSVGVDVGIESLITLSNGTKVENKKFYHRNERKIRKLSKNLSRKTRGSKRWLKDKTRLGLLHEHISNSRKDWINKTTRQLVDNYDLIAIEDIHIPRLYTSVLAKHIRDAGWGYLFRNLLYKAESAGVTIVKVDPRNTSQECSECGVVTTKTLKQRIHKCECGYTEDRDVNAARNILRRVPPEVTHGECTLVGGKELSLSRRGTMNREDCNDQYI